MLVNSVRSKQKLISHVLVFVYSRKKEFHTTTVKSFNNVLINAYQVWNVNWFWNVQNWLFSASEGNTIRSTLWSVKKTADSFQPLMQNTWKII